MTQESFEKTIRSIGSGINILPPPGLFFALYPTPLACLIYASSAGPTTLPASIFSAEKFLKIFPS